ncbi:hypothetical protein HPGCJGGD_1273 [Methylobacterium haplocladii]|nr:hypothetical protein HPGCJGGD_1273 [Methylobacterium haplocladii]
MIERSDVAAVVPATPGGCRQEVRVNDAMPM